MEEWQLVEWLEGEETQKTGVEFGTGLDLPSIVASNLGAASVRHKY